MRITTDPAADPQAQLACEAYLQRWRAEKEAEYARQDRQRQQQAIADQAARQRVVNIIGAFGDYAHARAEGAREACETQPKRYESRCRTDLAGQTVCQTVQVSPTCY